MKILLIDNGTRLLDKLQDLIPGIEITKRWNDITTSDIDNYDITILSGSSTSSVVWNYQDFDKEVDLIIKNKKPIIGICFGCELIAYAFGGTLKELNTKEDGIKEIKIFDQGIINKNSIKVYEHHKYSIDIMPEEFEVLAKSNDGPEIIKHQIKKIYGFQFHPENSVDKTEGWKLFIDLFNRLTTPPNDP